MICPERIAHVVIKVRNLERSRKFYIEVLEMDVRSEIPMPSILTPRQQRVGSDAAVGA